MQNQVLVFGETKFMHVTFQYKRNSHRLRSILFIALLSALSAYAETVQPDNETISGRKAGHTGPVSLVAVLADPEKYADTQVTLFGFYYAPNDRAPALFFSKDHAIYQDYSSAVIVGPVGRPGLEIFDECGGQYVSVSGTLNIISATSTEMEHLIVIADLTNVTVQTTNKTFVRCWPPRYPQM